jgi:hypothetical protein
MVRGRGEAGITPAQVALALVIVAVVTLVIVVAVGRVGL